VVVRLGGEGRRCRRGDDEWLFSYQSGFGFDLRIRHSVGGWTVQDQTTWRMHLLGCVLAYTFSELWARHLPGYTMDPVLLCQCSFFLNYSMPPPPLSLF
jgi:hypothetical protein